jgi:hypothetical protein
MSRPDTGVAGLPQTANPFQTSPRSSRALRYYGHQKYQKRPWINAAECYTVSPCDSEVVLRDLAVALIQAGLVSSETELVSVPQAPHSAAHTDTSSSDLV